MTLLCLDLLILNFCTLFAYYLLGTKIFAENGVFACLYFLLWCSLRLHLNVHSSWLSSSLTQRKHPVSIFLMNGWVDEYVNDTDIIQH
jgi:hypothetical protein